MKLFNDIVVNNLYLVVLNKDPWINNSTVLSPYLLEKSIEASTGGKHCKFPHTRKEVSAIDAMVVPVDFVSCFSFQCNS